MQSDILWSLSLTAIMLVTIPYSACFAQQTYCKWLTRGKIELNMAKTRRRILIYSVAVWNVIINICYCIVLWKIDEYKSVVMEVPFDFAAISLFNLFQTFYLPAMILLNLFPLCGIFSSLSEREPFLVGKDDRYWMNDWSFRYFSVSNTKWWTTICCLNILSYDFISTVYLLTSNLFGMEIFSSGLNERELFLIQIKCAWTSRLRCIILGFCQFGYVCWVVIARGPLLFFVWIVPAVASLSNYIFFQIQFGFYKECERINELGGEAQLVDCHLFLTVLEKDTKEQAVSDPLIQKTRIEGGGDTHDDDRYVCRRGAMNHGSLFISHIFDEFVLKIQETFANCKMETDRIKSDHMVELYQILVLNKQQEAQNATKKQEKTVVVRFGIAQSFSPPDRRWQFQEQQRIQKIVAGGTKSTTTPKPFLGNKERKLVESALIDVLKKFYGVTIVNCEGVETNDYVYRLSYR